MTMRLYDSNLQFTIPTIFQNTPLAILKSTIPHRYLQRPSQLQPQPPIPCEYAAEYAVDVAVAEAGEGEGKRRQLERAGRRDIRRQ